MKYVEILINRGGRSRQSDRVKHPDRSLRGLLSLCGADIVCSLGRTAVGWFATRHKYIPVGSAAATLPLTVAHRPAAVRRIVWRYLSVAFLGLELLLAGCQSLSLSGANEKHTAASGHGEAPAAAQAQFATAVAAQNAQQWADAEQQYHLLLEKFPQLSGPALNLALIYAQTQRPQLADDFFKRALQINPRNVDAGDQYGVWLRTQGRFDDAEKIYLQTLAINPDHAATQLNLAILYDLYLAKLPQALEHYQRYLELTNDEKSPVHGWVAELQRRLPNAG